MNPHPHAHRDLPKLRDSISYLYFEHGRIEQSKLGVEYVNKEGRILIPTANLTTLMLGPGSVVTHAAVQTLARTGCLVIWCGEGGVRFYAQGLGETNKAYKLMRQAELSADPVRRLQVVRRMYALRFEEPLAPELTLEQIRGMEGARVRRHYRAASKKYGISWDGRQYDREAWEGSDLVNRALSAANACLTGLCHAAILTAGYSPGLGFIHQGKQLAFAYDVADLYKARVTVPVAFATAAEAPPKPDMAVRKRCRQAFRNLRLMERIVDDIERVLDVADEAPLPDGFDPDADPALPTPWWEPPGGDGTAEVAL